MKTGIRLLVIFLMGVSMTSPAQIIPFHNYSVKNGLPNNVIKDIEQDHQGYLWFATQVGAVKFDGYNFKTYTIDDGLPDNNIIDLLVDSRNRIWIATESGGVAVMENNRVRVYNKENGLVSNAARRLFEDTRGNIWCTTFEGISIFTSNKIQNLDKSNSFIDSDVLCCYVALDGTVWLTNRKGVFRFDKKLHKFEHPDIKDLIIRDIKEDVVGSVWFASQENGVIHITNKNQVTCFNKGNGLSTNITLSLCPDGKSKMWIGTYDGGIYLVENDVVTRKWVKPIDNFIINDFLKDSRNRIWARTLENGIILIEKNSMKLISEKNNLVHDRLTKIFEDNSGNIWISSYNGISKYGKVPFEIYNEGFFKSDKNILSIAAIDGKVYIGTYTGLNIINLENNHVRNANIDLSSNVIPSIYTIKAESSEKIWLGTRKGLSLISNNSFYHYPDSIFLTENYFISPNDITIDKNNLIYCASAVGLIVFNREEYSLLTENDGLIQNNIWGVATDLKNNIWCATVEGLSIYDGMNFHNYDTSNGLPNNYCSDVVCDKNGNGWLATEKGISLIKLNKDYSIECHNFGKKEGLTSDVIFSVIVDKKGYVWAGHNKGLDRIDPQDYSVSHYGQDEGFLPVETSLGAVCLTEGEDIWFGTVDGAVRYIPDNDMINTDPPKVYITGVKVLNDSNSIRKYSEGIDSVSMLPIGLRLKYNKNNLVFQYVGLHFTVVEKNRYKYFLEGYDDDWSDPVREIEVLYRKIPPGKYVFKVLASNCDGIWTSEPAGFGFEILPPFWKTWWFYALEIILFIIALIVFIRLRERKLRYDKKVLAQKVKERTIEVEMQRDQISQQKEEITSSIVYAERIQSAVLPKTDFINSLLSDYFILFKPRDIVSGDFYWMDGADKKVIIVAADSTGHGVPGAFMSMLGISILNEVASVSKQRKAGKILDTLRTHLKETLWHTGKEEDTKDGMDLALCIIDFNEMTLQYSGAYNPLVHIHKDETIVYKADKMPVGFYAGEMKPFSTTEIKIEKGDCIYMFSDGYADQFGGPECKKFKSANLRDLLAEIHKLPMQEQKTLLEKNLYNWMGDQKQVDDILLIGVRI